MNSTDILRHVDSLTHRDGGPLNTVTCPGLDFTYTGAPGRALNVAKDLVLNADVEPAYRAVRIDTHDGRVLTFDEIAAAKF